MRKTVSLKSSYYGSAWLMVAPAILLLGLFVVIPAGLGLLSTFTSYSPEHANWTLVGLFNYQEVLKDRTLGSAFTNGIVLTVLAVPLELALALVIAALLRRPFRGRSYIRVILLLPWLVSPMAAGVMWHFLYNGQVGISAWLGSLFHSAYLASPLANPAWALPALVLSQIWRSSPLAAFLLLPGVVAVPQDQLDYALLEGSSNLTKWRSIIIPQMRVLLLTVALLLVGQSLSEFDSVLILTGGGPGTRTMTPALYSYNMVISGHNWPLGVTVAWLLEGVVLVVGIVYIILIRSEVH